MKIWKCKLAFRHQDHLHPVFLIVPFLLIRGSITTNMFKKVCGHVTKTSVLLNNDRLRSDKNLLKLLSCVHQSQVYLFEVWIYLRFPIIYAKIMMWSVVRRLYFS